MSLSQVEGSGRRSGVLGLRGRGLWASAGVAGSSRDAERAFRAPRRSVLAPRLVGFGTSVRCFLWCCCSRRHRPLKAVRVLPEDGGYQVTAFELPLSDAELSKWITDGRRPARRQRERVHLVLVGGEPSAGVDGWSGSALTLPADGVSKAILRRLRMSGKQAPPALTQGIATGVKVIKDAEDAADSGAGPCLGTFDIAGADTPPGGDVKPPMVKPNKFFNASYFMALLQAIRFDSIRLWLQIRRFDMIRL